MHNSISRITLRVDKAFYIFFFPYYVLFISPYYVYIFIGTCSVSQIWIV
jgi:hypothetical protein